MYHILIKGVSDMNACTYEIEFVYSTDISLYDRIEKQNYSRYNRRCIDGRITGCGNCVGYCQYSEHPGYLTKELRKQHNCINKKCFYYVPKCKQRGA